MILISFTLLYGFTFSCNKTPTYEEMKAAESKLIKRILAERRMEVLHEYPTDGVFGENQFFLLNSGIYLHVVDSGNGNRAVFDGNNSTDILVRASGYYYYKDTAYSFNTFLNSYPPLEFKYGSAYSVVEEHKYYEDLYYLYFGMGLESILSFVGDSAVVKLLVPGHAEIRNGSNSFPAGSSFQSSSGSYFVPIFYDRVRYIFYK